MNNADKSAAEIRLTDLSEKDGNGIFTERVIHLEIIAQITSIAKLQSKPSFSLRDTRTPAELTSITR